MFRYTIHRLLLTIPVLIGISVVVFLIMALIPGDPATAILGAFATPENATKLRVELGWIGHWLSNTSLGLVIFSRVILNEAMR